MINHHIFKVFQNTIKNRNNSGILSGTSKKTVQEWHLCNDEAGHNACPATITN
jgi:hypothetical protein